MIREWMPSDWLGFVMLATLAIVSAFSAYAEYIRSGDIGWVARRVDHTCELAIRLFRDHPRE
jgi:hypothetical protein